MQQFNDAFENHMSEILLTCNNNEFSLDTIFGDIKEKQYQKLQWSIKKNKIQFYTCDYRAVVENVLVS